MRAVICGLSLKYAPRGKADARTWHLGRSFYHQSVGREVQSSNRKGISLPQATRADHLAHGRDVHPSQK